MSHTSTTRKEVAEAVRVAAIAVRRLGALVAALDVADDTSDGAFSFQQVLDAAREVSGLTRAQLLKPSRDQLLYARAFLVAAYDEAQLSYLDIARLTGLDKTCIVSRIRAARSLGAESDRELQEALEAIKSRAREIAKRARKEGRSAA